MSHRCKYCPRGFKKAASRAQHEKASHPDRLREASADGQFQRKVRMALLSDGLAMATVAALFGKATAHD